MLLARNPLMSFESHVHRPAEVRSEHRRAVTAQAFQGLRRGMAIGIPGARRDDGDRRSRGRQEGVRRGRPAAVVGDLEHVHAWETALQQDRVDLLLDIAHQEEPVAVNASEQDDRDVVDGRAGVRRPTRHGVRIRPEHAERDGVERDGVPRCHPLRAPIVSKKP